MAKHSQARKNKSNILILLFIVLFIIGVIGLVISLNRNENDYNSFIGIWESDGSTKYEFKDNSTGYLRVPMGDYKFSYKTDNKKIEIDFESEESDDTYYEYEIKDNKLILKNVNGTFEFSKVESQIE